MSMSTRIYTLLFGTFVGKDAYNNRYYTGKRQDSFGRNKRWVMYHGAAEASKVPPEWHLWLHYSTDHVTEKQYSWQKEHKPNMTGTTQAYFPPGHVLKGGHRDKATGDYEPWTP